MQSILVSINPATWPSTPSKKSQRGYRNSKKTHTQKGLIYSTRWNVKLIYQNLWQTVSKQWYTWAEAGAELDQAQSEPRLRFNWDWIEPKMLSFRILLGSKTILLFSEGGQFLTRLYFFGSLAPYKYHAQSFESITMKLKTLAKKDFYKSYYYTSKHYMILGWIVLPLISGDTAI